MKTYAIFISNFKEWIRSKEAMFFSLFFPLIFIVIFSFIFKGETYSPERTFKIVIIDKQKSFYSKILIDVLKNKLKYPSGKNMFDVILKDSIDEKIIQDLKYGKISGIIEIPSDFPKSNPILTGLQGAFDFAILSQIMNGILEKFDEFMKKGKIEQKEFVKVKSISPSKFTTYDFVIPGMFIFGLLMLISSVASGITSYYEKGHINLLRLTKITSFDFLAGHLFSALLISFLQFFIMYFTARIFGYHPHGNVFAVLPFILIGGIGMGSIGLLISSFVKTTNGAVALSNVIGIPVSFASGVFYWMKSPVLFKDFFGQNFEILDLLPWRHLSVLLKVSLTMGENPFSQLRLITFLTIGSLILFIISIIIFNRKRLRHYLGGNILLIKNKA